MALGSILDVLSDSQQSPVVPRGTHGPRGATGAPTTRPDRSRGRPGLVSSSSMPIPRIQGFPENFHYGI